MDMADDIYAVIDTLKKEVQERARKATSKIADELVLETKMALAYFYNSYKPTRYTHRQQSILSTGFKRYYKNPHNKIYYGGVELTPEANSGSYHANYYPDHRAIAPNYIADLIYEGRHGATEMFPEWVRAHITNYPPQMSPSPRERIEEKLEKIKENISDYF